MTSGPVSGRGEPRGAQGLVNGVHTEVVALALWPAALACQRSPAEEVEAALEEALACAAACPHPLTRCCALTSLCREYFCIAGDRARGMALAERAQRLAAKLGLGHCSRSEPCRSPSIPFPHSLLASTVPTPSDVPLLFHPHGGPT